MSRDSSVLEVARNKKPRRLRPYNLINLDIPEDATQSDRDLAASTWKALRKYFRIFADVPIEDNSNIISGGSRCLGCDSILGGFLGTFRYGIAYGEGACSKCGYPCRAQHHIQDEHGEDLMHIGPAVLQYHPDELTERGDDD